MAYWTLLFFIIGGLFRRALGTSIYIGKFKISRFFKLIGLCLLVSLMYKIKNVFPYDLKSWLMFAWTLGWFIRYNSHTHGDYWILDEETPDEGRSWWVDKVLQIIFGKGGYYNFAGNFVGLCLGYLLPAILASITMNNHWFWIAGFTAPFAYAICEFTLKFTKRPTEFAEYFHGALMMSLFFINV